MVDIVGCDLAIPGSVNGHLQSRERFMLERGGLGTHCGMVDIPANLVPLTARFAGAIIVQAGI